METNKYLGVTPSLDTRSDFLDRMQKLTQSIQSIPVESNNNQSTKLDEEDPQMTKLRSLLEAGDSAEAFFMARSLVTSGEDWAREWMTKAQDMMD